MGDKLQSMGAAAGAAALPPADPTLAQAFAAFQSTASRLFPEAAAAGVSRCFVFEPSEELILEDGRQHIPGLVVFPPGESR